MTGSRRVQQATINTEMLPAGESYPRWTSLAFCLPLSGAGFGRGCSSSSEDDGVSEISRRSFSSSGSSSTSSLDEDEDELESELVFGGSSRSSSAPSRSDSPDLSCSSWLRLSFERCVGSSASLGGLTPCCSFEYRYGSAGGRFGSKLR